VSEDSAWTVADINCDPSAFLQHKIPDEGVATGDATGDETVRKPGVHNIRREPPPGVQEDRVPGCESRGWPDLNHVPTTDRVGQNDALDFNIPSGRLDKIAFHHVAHGLDDPPRVRIDVSDLPAPHAASGMGRLSAIGSRRVTVLDREVLQDRDSNRNGAVPRETPPPAHEFRGQELSRRGAAPGVARASCDQ